MWVSVMALLLPETKTTDEASRRHIEAECSRTPVATIAVTNPALAKPQRGCVCVLTNGSGSHHMALEGTAFCLLSQRKPLEGLGDAR